jgi:hypothetical protein
MVKPMKQTQVLNADKADSQIVFSNSMTEEQNFNEKDLVRLKPFGLSVSTDFARPFLLLKDEEHKYTLPVAVNPLEAGVALSQANKAVAPTTPHRFTELVLETLHIEIVCCVFVEL